MRFWRIVALRSSILAALLILGLCGRARASNATLTVGGSEQQISGAWDSGNITVSFNGFTETVHYGQFSTPAAVASALAGMFSRDYISDGLCAIASGAIITFHLKGTATFGPINVSGPTSSFQMSPTGWSSQVAVADKGTIQLTVNGVIAASANYGEGSTSSTVADALADGVTSNSPVSIEAVDGTLYLEAKNTGASTNYSYSVQTSYDSTDFSQPSFQGAPGSLQGGADSGTNNNAAVYDYTVSYQPNGNVQGYTDSVMGTWGFTYDDLDRISLATASQPGNANTNYCWSYDSFGNRTSQEAGTSAFQSGSGGGSPCLPQNPAWTSYNTSNRIVGGPTVPGYDAAGNITLDTNQNGTHQYLYDAEGRVCAVESTAADGINIMTGYVYDADGRRVAKGAITSWSCDPSTNGFEASANETDYVLDENGHQLTEMTSDGSSMHWAHTNVWADGQLIANYSASTDKNGNPTGTVQFFLNDWLGTRRAMTDYAGLRQQTCASLPYGDGETCASAPTEHLFTGKERDQESGNDYFMARYYASSMGRFLSPDWSAKEDPIPYAHLDDPQSLNLYSYVENNPLFKADLDGHGCPPDCSTGNDVLDFIGGLTNAWGSDNALGAGRMNQTSAAGQFGQFVGDAGATIQGTGEALLGAGGEIGGLALDATGVGALIGVPANVVSAAAIGHGLATGLEGATHMAMAQTKNGGSETEPTLPGKTVVNENGVEIKHYTRSGDHGPAHLHVEGNGPSTKIGMNGKPLKGAAELSSAQQGVVDNNKGVIRSTVDKIQRWFRFNQQ